MKRKLLRRDWDGVIRDFIRGIPMGGAKTLKEWDEWEENVRKEKPFRTFLADDLWYATGSLLRFPKHTYRLICARTSNLFSRKSYLLRSNLKKTYRHDFSTRLLHCAFDAFCEELRESDIDYIRWSAKKRRNYERREDELIELYDWWTITRPNRPSPREASGLAAYIAKNKEDTEDFDKTRRLYEATFELEERYHAEDDEMLKRLVDLRCFVSD